MYDINSDSKYEIALHLATNSDVVFSLCRSESLDDILCKFTVLQDKLPILMTVLKDVSFFLNSTFSCLVQKYFEKSIV